MYSLAYSDFVMPMVNAIKEQQNTITDLIKKSAEQESMISDLVKKSSELANFNSELVKINESQIQKLSSKLEEIEKRYPIRN